MAAFDPSVISSIPDSQVDVAADIGKALSIGDMVDRNQLQKLELGEKKRAIGEQQAVDKILKGSDYSTPEGLAKTVQQVNRVSPRAAMDLMKQGQQYQSGQISHQLDQLDLADRRQGLIVGAIDPIVAQAREMKNSGASDIAVRAFITQQMPQAIQQLRGMKLDDGKPALPDDVLQMVTGQQGGYTLATLEGWEAKSKQGQAAIKQRMEQLKADTAARGESEKERHDREMERLGVTKETYKEASDKGGAMDEGAIDLAANRIWNGEAARDVLANFGRGKQGAANITAVQNRLAQLAAGSGLSQEDQAKHLRDASTDLKALQKATQAAAGIVGKVETAAQELDASIPLARSASANVPRGAFVPWTKLKQIGEKNISDPNLKKLYVQTQTVLNGYDLISARGGTDKDKRAHNHEMLSTADSPEAYDAALQAIQQEIKVALPAARRAARAETYEAEEVPEAAPAPAAEVPTGAPVKPGEAVPPKQPLTKGNVYKHASGATVEIIDDGSGQ